MFRLITSLIFIAILAAAGAIGSFAAWGWYQGRDVSNGLKTIYIGLTDKSVRYTIAPKEVPDRKTGNVIWKGDIANHNLTEASGLVASTMDDHLYYAINDSGNEPQIFALKDTGEDVGFWRVDIDAMTDWEDLAAFEREGNQYLLIADTGDNYRWRDYLTMLVVRAPDINELPMSESIPVEWEIHFRYEGGHRDAEAVTIDEENERILILTKRQVPAEIYSLPLHARDGIQTARIVSFLSRLPQPSEQDLWEDPTYGYTRSQPTAFDMTGSRAVVLTYKDAWLYEKGWRQTWEEAFEQTPQRIRLPKLYQQESVALSADGKHLLYTTERPGNRDIAPVMQVDLK
ncbi:MAG: hypothetical protein KDI36_08850 [Pseudomonadales bacterium]|nr:hypothetical protein [Pseudomonadales bacterium]